MKVRGFPKFELFNQLLFSIGVKNKIFQKEIDQDILKFRNPVFIK